MKTSGMIIFGFKRKLNGNISLHLRESKRSHEEDVKHTRAASVRVGSEDGPLKLDFDGEEALGQELRFAVMPGESMSCSTLPQQPYSPLPSAILYNNTITRI